MIKDIVVKTIFYQNTLNFIKPSSIQIISTIFSFCSSNSFGGGIYIKNSQLNISLYYCSFENCSAIGTNIYGGGIYCEDVFNFKSHSLCFKYCFAERGNGFWLFDLNTNNKYIEFNFSDELNPSLCLAGSLIYSKLKLIYSNNNLTKTQCNIYSSLYLGCATSSNIAIYNNIYNCSGKGFLGFYSSGISLTNTFKYFNFIKNNPIINSGWLTFIDSRTINLEECIFLFNSQEKIIFDQNSNSGLLYFYNCNFDIEYNYTLFIKCQIFNCNFLINSNSHEINLLNTFLCWNNNEQLFLTKANYLSEIQFIPIFYSILIFQ